MSFRDIVALAKKHHNGQKYGELPYYDGHLLRVTDTLVLVGFLITEELEAIAILHDILEDTDCTEQEILDVAGAEVLRVVKILTKQEGETRKEYLQRVITDEKARTVKLADAFVNMEKCFADLDFLRAGYYADTISFLCKGGY